MAGWENFFIAEVGAAAALGGLLFVSISLNLTKILAIDGLPDRAGQSLLLILAVLVLASLMLMPNQPLTLVGVEILVVSVVTLGTGRTTVLQGIVHIFLFAVFVFLAVVP